MDKKRIHGGYDLDMKYSYKGSYVVFSDWLVALQRKLWKLGSEPLRLSCFWPFPASLLPGHQDINCSAPQCLLHDKELTPVRL